MDEVAWGPGTGTGSEVQRARTRLLARLGADRPARLRRLSLLLLAAGYAMTAGAQLLPWVSVPGSGPSGQVVPGNEVSMADAQSIMQIPYYLTVALVFALCGAALFAARRSRRALGGAAIGAVWAHLLLLVPFVKLPYRLYGTGYVNNARFGDGIGFHRGAGMALGVLGVVVLGVAVAVALLADWRGHPADEDDTDRVRPSDLYRPADPPGEPEAGPDETPARRWIEDVAMPATPPARIPANQFAFEGHADLPTDSDAGTRSDHSMYMRPRLDTDISAR